MASELIDLASNFQLPDVAAQIASAIAPANTSVQPLSFTVTNTTGAARSFNIYRVPPGGAATNGNKIVSSRGIAANATYVAVEVLAQGLPAGFSIWGDADVASSLSIAASGALYTDE
jgi:hypothetical protein